jgi:hypothetical protein
MYNSLSLSCVYDTINNILAVSYFSSNIITVGSLATN